MDFQAATDADFEEALKLCLQYEGGYTHDPTDTGGETNYGITHLEYDAYRHHKGLPQQSIRNISMAEVRDIYYHSYWVTPKCNLFTRRVAIACFDWEVNSGRGIITLQKCLGVNADGYVGPATMNEFRYWLSKPTGEDRLLHNFFESRECSYRRWGTGDQAVFLDGWLSRAENLREYLKVPAEIAVA